jgi:TonB family protein
MKALAIIALALLLTAAGVAQSGRKSTKPPSPATPVVSDPNQSTEKPVTALAGNDRNRNQIAIVAGEEYKCMDDDSLGVVVHSEKSEQVLAPNEVTSKANIRFRPKPEYTTDARQRAVQGTVSVRVVLGAGGKVYSAKIINKGLPFGLNDSAIHAACKIEFTPATKDGQPVSQWQKLDYPFRLESSVFRR